MSQMSLSVSGLEWELPQDRCVCVFTFLHTCTYVRVYCSVCAFCVSRLFWVPHRWSPATYIHTYIYTYRTIIMCLSSVYLFLHIHGRLLYCIKCLILGAQPHIHTYIQGNNYRTVSSASFLEPGHTYTHTYRTRITKI